jgi:hypothetical protein
MRGDMRGVLCSPAVPDLRGRARRSDMNNDALSSNMRDCTIVQVADAAVSGKSALTSDREAPANETGKKKLQHNPSRICVARLVWHRGFHGVRGG